jgi:hypothetical protein
VVEEFGFDVAFGERGGPWHHKAIWIFLPDTPGGLRWCADRCFRARARS